MKSSVTVFQALNTYVYYRCKNQHHNIIQSWLEKLSREGDFSFETGLLGFGWFTSYVIRTDNLEKFSHFEDILEESEDLAYRSILSRIYKHDVEVQEMIYFLSYLQERLLKKNLVFFRSFCLLECITLITSRLNKKLKEENSLNCNIIKNKIDILLKYSALSPKYVRETDIETFFYRSVESLIDLFQNNKHILSEKDTEQYLSKLFMCVSQYGNPIWENQIYTILENINLCDNIWINIFYKRKNIDNIFSVLRHSPINNKPSSLMFDIVSNVKL